MGTVSFRQDGYGMSQKDAYENALRADRDENGYKDGFSGGMNSCRSGTLKVKMVSAPVVGKAKLVKREYDNTTRTWETRYVVRYDIEGYGSRYEGWVGYKLTQGEAIELAKQYTTKTGCECQIVIEKVCTSNNHVVGVVKSQGTKEGHWVFTGEARE